MKLIHKFLLVGISTFLLHSCVKLTENPDNFISPSNFYKTERDAKAAVTACYRPFTELQYYVLMHILITYSSDNSNQGRANANAKAVDEYTFDAGNGHVIDVWNKIYQAINAANAVTEYVPQIQMDEITRQQIVAEAKFLRALSYFNLVRMYGAVPLHLQPTTGLDNLNLPQSSVDDVYAAIIADLEEGADLLPVSYAPEDHGRATKYAAQALLAKVYLTRENWQKAAEYAKVVIDALPNGLFPDIEGLWLVANQDAPEFIFSLQSMPNLGVPNIMTIRSMPRVARGQGIGWVEPAFLHSFHEGDFRRDVSIWTTHKQPNGNIVPYTNWSDAFPHMAKWRDAGNFDFGTNTGEANSTIIRFSDVLLMYAEALSEDNGGPTDEAYQAVNRIRRRAYKEDINSATPQSHDLPAGLNREDFRDAVIQERAWELCFEWNRWFDLVRTKKLVEVMKPTKPFVSEKNYLFPIPQPQIELNPNLIQNKDY